MTFKDDHLISAWAKDAVYRSVARGLLQGDPDGNFRPKDYVTREELAVVLDRAAVLEQELEDEDRLSLFKTVADSVVEVRAGDSFGSGVVVYADYVVTNAHVVGENKRVEVVWPSVYATPGLPHFVGPMADVVAVDADNDLALVKLGWQVPLTCQARIARDWTNNDYTNRHHFGRRVYIVGTPLGFKGHLSECTFNGIHMVFGSTYMILDGHVNPGNSGGPIFNVLGELVGVVVAKLIGERANEVEGMGVGIPLSRVLPFLEHHGLPVI